MKTQISYCPVTKKFCYSSEAKATRAMQRYEEIKRVYFCEHCESWHTTSMGMGLALQEGVIEEVETGDPPSEREIAKRIKKLERKLAEE